jgi:hypothetical protein
MIGIIEMTKKPKTVEFEEDWAKELLDEGLMTPEGIVNLEKLIKDAIESNNKPDETVH